MNLRLHSLFLAALLLASALKPAQAQLTITQSSATDWKISNGAISLDFDSTAGDVWSMYLTGYSTDLVDTTHCCTNSHPSGLYMDNTATNFNGITQAPTGVTPTAGYTLVAGSYLDWWMTWAPTSASPWGVSQHYIVQPNDPTLYAYTVVTHPSSSAAATWGQLQYVYRINQTEFNNTYQLNSGLNNLGGWAIALPSVADMSSTDPGRAVQNAVEDLHGFSLPSNFGREFYTKYDYSSYQYLLQVNGNYGPNFGAWSVVPSTEYMAGGPTKQVEVYTGNILMGELLSGHLANAISYNVAAGANTTRIWGPIGFHFNRFSNLPAMYQDALNIIPGALTLFGKDSQLIASGYVPDGSGRGTLQADITGGGSSTPNTAWTVLTDQFTNMQYSTQGAQYWASNNSSGSATIDNVTPGTYRLSSYVLGEWGQLREDGVKISPGSTTTANLTFTPENFSASAPIWTIGTPDRSAHEFLHGENNYGGTGSCAGCDDREYQGAFNYWSDFAANDGAVIYYATPVGSTPATNNLQEWNYIQWGAFDPGLYAGVYNSADDTTDGYQYIIPSYVKSLSGETGTDGVGTVTPPWQVHFATTAAQNAQGSFVDVSVGLAATEADMFASLNGHSITWHALNQSDADVRSGLSGYYQWIVFEWPTSDLVAAGGNNELALSVNGSGG
ncbi:MAG: polysaccharide lyase family protein, partial [Terracidiphilus sp.]